MTPSPTTTRTCACGTRYTAKTPQEVAEKIHDCWQRTRVAHEKAQARRRGVGQNGRGWL